MSNMKTPQYVKIKKFESPLDPTTCFAISVLEEYIERRSTEGDDYLNGKNAISDLKRGSKNGLLRFIQHRKKKKQRKKDNEPFYI